MPSQFSLCRFGQPEILSRHSRRLVVRSPRCQALPSLGDASARRAKAAPLGACASGLLMISTQAACGIGGGPAAFAWSDGRQPATAMGHPSSRARSAEWLERVADWSRGRGPMARQQNGLQPLFDSMPATGVVTAEPGRDGTASSGPTSSRPPAERRGLRWWDHAPSPHMSGSVTAGQIEPFRRNASPAAGSAGPGVGADCVRRRHRNASPRGEGGDPRGEGGEALHTDRLRLV